MNKIAVIKKIDSLLGPFIVHATGKLFRPRAGSGKNTGAWLIVRPGGIGDAVLLIPAVLLLKKMFPGAAIDILAEKRNSGVYSLCPEVGSVFRYDVPAEFREVIQRTYDVVIDTEQWHRLSAAVARVTRAPHLIGYGTNERKKLFTHAISYSQDDYEVESFFHLLTPMTGEVVWEQDVPFLKILPDLTVKAKALLSHLPNSGIVAMFPGSSINERKWGSERFHQTAKLLGEQGCSIVVVGGKGEAKAGHQIVSGLSNSLNLCGKLTLPETAAILKESSLLITGDSGIMHIGYGLGIKVIALFGPGREKKWGPRGKDCKVINKHLPCSPCTTFGYTPKCGNNAECMGAITVEEVVSETLALLDT